MATLEFAQTLLTAAARDWLVWRKLVNDPQVHDSTLGFHAQQAVEKWLKAVLAHAAVAFRRTHDLAELLDLLADNGLPPPPHAEHLDELNPFAVEARYGLGAGPLNRDTVSGWLASVSTWAHASVGDTGAASDGAEGIGPT